MAEQEKFFAVERLAELKAAVLRQSKAMVVSRAKVEKYREADLAAAKDCYLELKKSKTALEKAIFDARLLLMEVEEYELAGLAGKLSQGLAGFDLMSTNYKSVYDVLQSFSLRIPAGDTVNAKIVGRLMNQIKLGYYPTDPANIDLMLKGITFPEGMTTNLLDPCCGCGKALRQLAQGNNCYTYGVELDEFLIESIRCLMHGGLLIYVIPYYRLTPDICRVLTDNFDDLTVWRFTDAEFQRFRQVAVMGIRKRKATEPGDTLRLERYAVSPDTIPNLSEMPEGRYTLPERAVEVATFKGEIFNERELEQQLRRSDSFEQMMTRSELDSGVKHPLLPLSIGQIGLIGGSGMINGLIECEHPHIIKGRIVKVVHTENEEKFTAEGKHMGTEVREVVTNKMIFNILTPQGFKSLT